MAYVRDDGSGLPSYVGMATYSGLTVNDGTFRLAALPGLVDAAPIRLATADLAAAHGAFADAPFWAGRAFRIEGSILTGLDDDLASAQDDLQGAFGLTSRSAKVLTVNRKGWTDSRIVTAFVQQPLTIAEDSVSAVVPWREFTVGLFAPDPRVYGSTLRTIAVTSATPAPNAGNMNAPLVVTFTGGTNPTLSDGTTTLALTGTVSGTVTIDALAQTAVDGGGGNVYGMVTGFAVPEIPPDGSSLTLTGGGTATVAYHDTWMSA